MIYILKEKNKEKVKDISKQYLTFHKPRIEKRIKEMLSKGLPKTKIIFLSEILLNLDDLLIGMPDVLEKQIEKFHDKAKLVSYKKLLKSIFNYNRDFVKKYSFNEMGAYTVAKELNLSVCPYCNRHYIFVFSIDGKKGRVRPHFDHFLDKETYPYLAISFYNLIPCCSICNSSLKGSIPFSIRDYIHPYMEGFEDLIKFSVKFNENSLDFTSLWRGETNTFELELKSNKSYFNNIDLINKAQNNINVFKLKELYQFHKDYVAEMIVKAHYCTPSNIESITRDLPNLFNNKEEIMRYVFGNYIQTEQLGDRVLAKLTKDIVEEFDIKF